MVERQAGPYFQFISNLSHLCNSFRCCSEASRKAQRVTVLVTSILVVDDDVGVRNMLSSVLSGEGYDVEAVENGKQAVKTCEKSPFDVALIDIELPDMKGTDLLDRLKRIRPKMIRIIITGHPSLESAMKAVNERADGYLLKPFEVKELLEKIKRLLEEKTTEYLRMLSDTARARDSTPTVRYQRPDKW
jgi:DNA-binding NtrC family response regulator